MALSPKTITLLVKSSPLSGVQHTLALDYIRAALAQGHAIKRVFFYQDGVYAGLYQQAPQGQTSVHEQWRLLAQEGEFPLQCCIANAIRRGVLDVQEATRYQCTETLGSGYELAGLGELVAAHHDSDRIVTF